MRTAAGADDGSGHIRVFTTRIDTIYGANAVVVAAEHPVIVEHLGQLSDDVHAKIQQIRAEKMNPTDHETEAVKDGIDTGLESDQPVQRRRAAGLGRQLRDDGLRHRCGDERAGPRRAGF